MVKHNKFRLIVINATIIITLFWIFSFAIFNLVKAAQYKSVDKELLTVKNRMTNGFYLNRIRIAPRMTVLIKDSDGKILNNNSVPKFYYENQDILNEKTLNEVKTIEVDKNYFRTICFNVTSADNKTRVIQLLVDINSTEEVINNLLYMLLMGGAIMVIVSIGVSWFLSGKSMEPIIESWKKQKQFVEDASHELRTPLTTVKSRLELLLRDPESKIIDNYDDIEPALSEVNRLNRLVADLLTLARSDSNVIEIEENRIDIKSIVENIIEPYAEIGEMQEKKVYTELSPAIIWGDEGRIKQLIIILLDNAIKYTQAGDYIKILTLEVDNKVLLSVEDSGIGIKQENKAKVFERFFVEDKSRTKANGGTGLGLSIAQWIVTKHNGTIEAKDNMPKGTKFIVTIPIKASLKKIGKSAY